MLKELVDAIQDGTKAEIKTVNGIEYVTREVFIPPPEPSLATLNVHTLTGFLDYLKTRTSELENKEPFIHVESPTMVSLLDIPLMRHRKRDYFCTATAITSSGFKFGQWQDVENFIIAMQSHFVRTDEVSLILQLVGNLRDEVIRTSEDDGITQIAAIRKGVARVASAEVPNPVSLRPYRTFTEIEQPASSYVLRLKSGDATPSVALFEIADNRWQLEAITSLRSYLADKVGDVKIIA